MRFHTIFILSISLMLASCANQPTGQAAVGGGLGGALGGAFGSEVGGRTGAIIGSSAGAAAGAAIATDGYDKSDDHDHYRNYDRYDDDRYDDDDGYRYPKRHYKRKHCPPGLAMQGRC